MESIEFGEFFSQLDELKELNKLEFLASSSHSEIKDPFEEIACGC